MKKFLLEIVGFAALPIAVVCALAPFRAPVKILFGEEVDAVIMGDSHAQLAFNDELPDRAVSLAGNSEVYTITFPKLRYVVENRPQIDQVYLSFNYHSLSSYLGDYAWGDQAKRLIRQHASLMTWSERFNLFLHNRDLAISLLRGLLPHKLSARYPDEKLTFRRFYNPYETDVKMSDDFVRRRVKEQFFHKGEMRQLFATNTRLLDEMIAWCSQHDVELIFVQLPLHEKYVNRIPEFYRDTYDALTKSYELRHIDFGQLDFPDEFFLPDGDHLTRDGARMATAYFVESVLE